MKPYLAILIDSFHEAIGNRVLWALLIGWSLVLIALAPFGYISERGFRLSSVDIEDRVSLLEKLAQGVKGQGSLEVLAVASNLEPAFAQRIARTVGGDESSGQRRINSSELAQELNVVISNPRMYSEQGFPSAKRRPRLRPLLEAAPESLSHVEVEELNRELLQLAFPLELNRAQGEQLWIGYANFKIGEPLPVSRRQIKQFLEPVLLGAIIKLGLGILAVFVAIVVTSPIIPETFRSGSLHLLLSKPISRVWLYLAKFLGGCIFVLVNITFVLIGLYLIAGLRFDIWNVGLLACIPLLMFVFIIFYSVSALVGLVWGNAIVSVVACMLFWLFCFSIGFMHDAMIPQVEILPQISRIREIEGRLMTVNERGTLSVWNSAFSVWQPALEPEVRGQVRTFGPIYDEQRRLIITKSFFRVPFGGLQTRSRKLSIIRLNPNEDSQALPNVSGEAKHEKRAAIIGSDLPITLGQVRETPVWMADLGPELPPQLFEIIEMGDIVLAICRGGLYSLDLEKLELVDTGQKGLFGIKLPWLASSAFENIAPKDYVLSANSQASATQAGDGLIVFSSGSLDYLEYQQGKLVVSKRAKLDGDGTEAALVQMNAQHCIVARDGLPIQIMDSELKPLAEIVLPNSEKVRQMAWIPDTGDLAIVTHTGGFWRLVCETASITQLAPSFSGKCTTMRWVTADKVWLGLKPNSVGLLDLVSGKLLEQKVPQPTTLDRIFRWVVQPIYVINPKPAALDNATTYLLSGRQTQSLGLVTHDLSSAQVEIDIWRPIISNLIFVVVVLGGSCIYVARKEF